VCGVYGNSSDNNSCAWQSDDTVAGKQSLRPGLRDTPAHRRNGLSRRRGIITKKTSRFFFVALVCLLLTGTIASAAMAPGMSDDQTGTLQAASRQLVITTTPSLARPTTSSAHPIGTLILDSVPSGAGVYIDGSYMGTTPFTLRTLSAGNHVVVLKMAGFYDYQKTITITTGGVVQETWMLVPVTTVPTTTAPRRELVTTTQTPGLARGTLNPVVTTTTPAPVRVVVPVTTVAVSRKDEVMSNLCHYDPMTMSCTGICPQTGRKCQEVKESSCEATSLKTVKCGCVDPYSHISRESAGLVSVEAREIPGFVKPNPKEKGLTETIVGFATGFVKPKPDLRSADPNAYTMETTASGYAQRAETFCAADAFRTVLRFSEPSSEYIDTTTGDQKGHFVWDSADPRIGSVVWQASILPFPPTSGDLSNVSGLMAQGNLLGTQHQFTIDFSETVPTSAEMATVWSDRKTFLTMQKNALMSFRTQRLQDVSLSPAGSDQPVNAAARAKFSTDLDTAISTSTARAQNPPKYTLKSLSGKPATLAATQTGSSTFQIASGVLAPVLAPPRMTKEGLASTLPQVQRTFYIRVVPFDKNGNATGYPSNTKEVIVGEPVYDTTGPWSEWNEVAAFDQSGFKFQPTAASFNGRTYFFNVRDNYHIYVSSQDAQGSTTGWSEVPGSMQTDEPVRGIGYQGYLYLFMHKPNSGVGSGIWNTRMNSQGVWDSNWIEVPGQPSTVVLDHPYPTVDKYQKELHLIGYDPSHFSVYKILGSKGAGWPLQVPNKYSNVVGDWNAIGGNNDYIISFISSINEFRIYPVQNPQGLPSSTVSVPPEITGGQLNSADAAAFEYGGRIYFLVRGKEGHIYANWLPVIESIKGKTLGPLNTWTDISPDSAARGKGIIAIPSSDGSRVDIFTSDIETTSSGGSGFTFSILNIGPPKAPTLYRKSLSLNPGTTQLVASAIGDRISSAQGHPTHYTATDVNISWTRTDPFWFAWNSSRTDLMYAEWQVSVRPFDETNPRFDEIGIVARGRLNATAGDKDYLTDPLPSYLARAHFFPVNFKTFGTPVDQTVPGHTQYYLRVIAAAPTDTPGRYRAYSSRQIEAAWGPQDQVIPKFCSSPKVYTYNYQMPEIRIVGYTPTQRQDKNYQCYGIVTTGWDYYRDKCLEENKGTHSLPDPYDMYHKNIPLSEYCDKMGHAFGSSKTGDEVNLCPPPEDKAWYEELWETFKDYIDMLKTILDAVAKQYNNLKSTVASAVCGGDPVCTLVVESGINAGMAALGVPPTIPNFDELMDKGIDYLATSLAEETGVPGSDLAAKAALTEMAEEMKHKPNPKDSKGIQLNTRYQYKPATLMIELKNSDPNNRTAPGSFRIKDTWGLFRTAEPDVPYPALDPKPGGNTVVFPVVLKEDQWKGYSCSSGLEGSDVQESGSCDDIYAGQINNGWWNRFQQAWDKGGGFSLEYQGLTQNFTTNITEVMSRENHVPLNSYQTKNAIDITAPDCWQDKYVLEFVAYDNHMQQGNENMPSIAIDSFGTAWGDV
jgi:hypothetical protein